MKKFIFYFLLTGMVIAGIYASKNSFLLKTPHAPHGMLSLELCYSNSKQAALLKEWNANSAYEVAYSADSGFTRTKIHGIPTAIADTQADFAFILFYVSFLSMLIYRDSGQYKSKGFLNVSLAISLVVVAGLMDCLENIFELSSMHAIQRGSSSTGLALLVSIPATIKWGLIIFSIIYYYILVLKPRQDAFLISLNALIKDLVIQLWHFRIVIIGLFVIYAVLNQVDQGKDLLVAINSSGWGIFWFIMVIFVLAVLNWYLPKTYDRIYNKKKLAAAGVVIRSSSGYVNDSSHIKRYLGRVIGSATLLVPATGILTSMQSYHMHYPGDKVPTGLLFIFFIFLFVELPRYKVLDKIYFVKNSFKEGRYWVTFILLGILIVVFAGLSADQTPGSLIYLSLAFFVLAFLFLLTVNYREYFKHSLPYQPVLIIISAAVFLLFLLFNFRHFSEIMTDGNRFFSLPVFISGLVFYTLLISMLLVLGRKYNFYIVTVLFLLAVFTSLHAITDFHKVSIVSASADGSKDSLRTYIHNWFESRRTEIDAQNVQNRDYPVFFVNAHGGGIKAAAWTAMVVGQLNKMMRGDTINSTAFPDFEHYVFSYSGASGGTIGLSLLAGARITYAADPLKDTVFSSDALRKVFEYDYLTNDLVGILGRDAWMGSTGLNLYADRAKVSEEAWEKHTGTLGVSYSTPFGCGWRDPKMEVPLFVSNTYDIDGGNKAILAPVKLRQSDFPGVLMIQELLKKGQDIHLSSAAFLSARFPYVSPTGKFDENHHFTDGGTIENAGAETSMQLINVFQSIRDSLTGTKGRIQDTIFKRIKICILSIPNSILAMDSIERARNRFELGAPIAGILNSIDGNSRKAEATNKAVAGQKGWHYYQMRPANARINGGKVSPVLPLGWQISNYALDMMEASVKRDTSDIVKIRALFLNDFKKIP